jgi:soluble lytic murein transglycosylase-like protein
VKIDDVEKFMKIQMMNQMFKTITGDSKKFQMVMDTIVDAMDKDTSGGTTSNTALTNANYDTYDFSSSPVNSGNMDINSVVEKASNKYNVDKDLINAVIKQESSFDPRSTSSSGAMGLMQLMPGTAKELGVTNAYDIGQNVDGGTKYLRGLLDMYGNSKELALSAYNAGSGTLNSRGVKDKSDIDKLPYETRDYVKKVMKYYGK